MAKNETVELQKPDIRKAKILLKGLSPIIMNRWSDKAKGDMLKKQMKQTVAKVAKDPESQYQGSIYRIDKKRIGFPADAFKKSMVRGAKQLGLVMTDMRTGFFVHGEYSEKEDRELIPIKGNLSMREDTVRIGGGTADLRYRAQVTNWTAELTISYNATIVSLDHIVNMLSAAGYGVGVGDWRPEKDGMFGRFEVVSK